MMEALKQLEALFLEKIAVFKTVRSIICLEAQLAGLSVFPLLLNICMLLVVLITVWLSTMFLIGYFILLISDRPILSILFIVFLNIGLFLGLLKYLSFNLKNMSFKKTREYFSQNKSIKYELKNANNSPNCQDGQCITRAEKKDS